MRETWMYIYIQVLNNRIVPQKLDSFKICDIKVTLWANAIQEKYVPAYIIGETINVSGYSSKRLVYFTSTPL